MVTTTPTESNANGERKLDARLYLAFDLGASSWKLAFATAPGETPRIRTTPAGDLDVLDKEIVNARLRFHLRPDTPVWSCYEAGRDGFWVHRALTARGITNDHARPPRRHRSAVLAGVKVAVLTKVCLHPSASTTLTPAALSAWRSLCRRPRPKHPRPMLRRSGIGT